MSVRRGMSAARFTPALMIKVDKAAVSNFCAAAGVLLVVLASVAPENWPAVPALFAGLGLLVVSHVLTPCLDRIAVWRKQLLK